MMGSQVIRSCVKPVRSVGRVPSQRWKGWGHRRSRIPFSMAFMDEGAAQCGYCLSGVILTAKALLEAKPDATDQEICEALGGRAVLLFCAHAHGACCSPLC
jgi:nicotinate dehydrogenase subunit A